MEIYALVIEMKLLERRLTLSVFLAWYTHTRIAARAASLLDQIRKYIDFEGSPDIIEALNEFTE